MNNYYADFITDSFKAKIEKKQLQVHYFGNIIEYVYLFIDTDNCECIFVHENELDSKRIENSDFTNIIVLLKTESIHAGYRNHNYFLIGIYNNQFQENGIEFESISITSFNIMSHFNFSLYDTAYIDSFEIVLLNNPFEKYIKSVMSPIQKAINKYLPKDMGCNCSIASENEQFRINIYKKLALTSPISINNFEDFLNELYELDEKITSNLCYRIFKPEDYQ